jgi:hypothetical protein
MEMKKLSDFKRGNGYIRNDVLHEDIDMLLASYMNFCCCGDVEEALNYVMTWLELINNTGYMNIDKQEDWFVIYALDSFGLTEHGTSICGCWLSDKGEELLSLMKEWHGSNVSNE